MKRYEEIHEKYNEVLTDGPNNKETAQNKKRTQKKDKTKGKTTAQKGK